MRDEEATKGARKVLAIQDIVLDFSKWQSRQCWNYGGPFCDVVGLRCGCKEFQLEIPRRPSITRLPGSLRLCRHLRFSLPFHSTQSDRGKMLSRGPRRARCLPVELARWSRSNSTIPTPHPPPARPPLAPTTFSDKSAPRPVYERPEQIRGMPPNSAPSFAKPHVTSATVEGAIPTPDASAAGEKTVKEVMAESFSGPSRPRMVYPLPPKKPRDLPKLGVSSSLTHHRAWS